MTIKQISVFLENTPGRLAAFTEVLRQHNISMRAMSIAEAPDFGVARIIVNDTYQAICVLKEAGYVFSITPVLAVGIPDEAGSLCHILNLLGENEINIEYTYAFTAQAKGRAYMIFRVADNDKAIEVLSANNIPLIAQDEM